MKTHLRKRSRRLLCELLEDRRLLDGQGLFFGAALPTRLDAVFASAADSGEGEGNGETVFTVTNTADDGPGSLRVALLAANASATGPVSIQFQIPVSNPGFGDIDSGLSGGDPQPGVFVIRPQSPLPPLANALFGIALDGRTQVGLTGDTNPAGPVIVLDGSSEGLNATGLELRSDGNAVFGLNIQRFANQGIFIEGSDNLIAENYIGTDPAGSRTTQAVGEETISLGNGVAGIDLWHARRNEIRDNVISGNGRNGVRILGPEVPIVHWPVSEGGNGHYYVVSPRSTWAAAEALARQLDNDGDPDYRSSYLVTITSAAEQEFLNQNFFSEDAYGNEPFFMGLTDEAEEGTFVWVTGEDTSYTNWPEGEPNNLDGEHYGMVNFHSLGTWNDVGADWIDRGIIELEFAPDMDILLPLLGTGDNQLRGNKIGTDATGRMALPNGSSGVYLERAHQTLIGGVLDANWTLADGNLISSNGGDGITVETGSTGTQILGNYIGTDVDGSEALGNARSGIKVYEAGRTTIGTSAVSDGNLISGHGSHGVFVENGAEQAFCFTNILGNRIGTTRDGLDALPNAGAGIHLANSSWNVIGGSGLGQGNLISGNEIAGIWVYGEDSRENVIQGNVIGLTVGGDAALSNAGHGVYVELASQNQIGPDNAIAYNLGDGVHVIGDMAVGNTIRGNASFDNAGLGIDLEGDGVTPNDLGDEDSGANHLQNYPLLSIAMPGSSTLFTGRLDAMPHRTYTIDFYASPAADPSGYGEGARYLGFTVVTTDAAGTAIVDTSLAALGANDEYATATATDDVGNTSEFSPAIPFRIQAPAGQQAMALNQAVLVSWQAFTDPANYLDHYAVYRATQPFSSVAGMTPLAIVTGAASTQYRDETAENGTSYYYAVTTVAVGGDESTEVESIGPRTPRDETDLQVVSVSRQPQFPRYFPEYRYYDVTEPDTDYGPYVFSSSPGLLGGQTFADQRFPTVGDPVTYTATVRNRGTNPIQQTLNGQWFVDGTVTATVSQAVDLAPGETVQFTFTLNWDDQPHELLFRLNSVDARPANDQLVSDTLAVPFLTYVDRSYLETFREVWTDQYPQAATDDLLDWLNAHMARFNELFAQAGTDKRVHYGVLELIDDHAPDPAVDPANNPYAMFPFRYRSGVDDDPRAVGYYNAAEDIDYGLLHEMGHQLGLIDLYQLDVPAEANLVSGLAYQAPHGLMRNVVPFLSEHSALAMEHWLHDAHGYYGQYLYNIPETIKLRLLDYQGQPLSDAQVTMYQYAERSGQGKVISDQVKASGATDEHGYFTLPNVDIDETLVPPVATGDVLHDNPFGYVAVVGTNGVLHFGIEKDGEIDYCWLDITEANVAYWQGNVTEAVFDRQLMLGMPLQLEPPADLAEPTAGLWIAWADGATASAEYDTSRTIAGTAALRFATDGGFDTIARYPGQYRASWDLSAAEYLALSVYAENDNPGQFQSASPWIQLIDEDGSYYQYQYWRNGEPVDLLNDVIEHWATWQIPLDAPAPVPGEASDGWRRTTHGTPDVTRIEAFEFHADTWEYGFTYWLDGVGFDRPIAHQDSYIAPQNGALSVEVAIGLLANDVVPPGSSLTAEVGTEPAHGTLNLNPDGSFSYTPDAGYIGSDRFTYVARAGATGSNLGTVVLDVRQTTFGVINTEDAGPGSLRAALLAANAASVGPLRIEFQIPDTDPGFIDVDSGLPGGDPQRDVFLIRPQSPLPPLANASFGIVLDGRTQVSLTGDTNPAGPVIVLDGSTEGLNATGLEVRSDENSLFGLNIQSFLGHGISVNGSDNLIAGNAISGNQTWGISIYGAESRNNVVQGNVIGLQAGGSGALGNVRGGIQIQSPDNVIGGVNSGEANVISGNLGSGIELEGGSSAYNTILGNYVGTDPTGALARGNLGNGITILQGAHHNTIGGTADGAANVLSGNSQAGVGIFGSDTRHNLVQGNWIGVAAGGQAALSNAGYGIQLAGGPKFNTIDGNVIGSNGESGIRLVDLGTDDNVVVGNWIGTDRTGLVDLGNGRHGIEIANAARNQIGGILPGQGNAIARNRADGVHMVTDGAVGNTIRGNAIYDNAWLGIDLGGDGVTANDPGDADRGPNELQNFPQLAAAVPGAVTRITGLLASEPDRSYTVDFYAGLTAGASGRGEATRYLGSLDLTTDATGTALVDASLPVLSSSGEWVTATATDAAGNTSEFTLAIPVHEFPWQNRVNMFDVDADGVVAPLDVLIVINFINAHPGQLALPPRYDAALPFYDVSGDASCDAADVLSVVNYINRHVLGSPAGETADATIALAPSIALGSTDALGSQLPDENMPFGWRGWEGTEPGGLALVRAEREQAGRQARSDHNGAVDRLFAEAGTERQRKGESFRPGGARPISLRHSPASGEDRDGVWQGWPLASQPETLADKRRASAAPFEFALEAVLDDLVEDLRVV